ncbi:MAG: hypothetical protein AAF602_18045, partial [Myxococcota bacterium]
MHRRLLPAALLVLAAGLAPRAQAHDVHHDGYHTHQQLDGHGSAKILDAAAPAAGEDPFRQLTEVLPDPNEVRLASGAPGPEYWQNEADHVIDVSLDPETHRLTGSERITYRNRSPHVLEYLWVQLDQNRFRDDSIGALSETSPDFYEDIGLWWLVRKHAQRDFDGGMTVSRVVDAAGRPLPHTIVDTMMRIDLPRPLRPGSSVRFGIDWSHQMVPEAIRARSRVEVLDDGLPLYEVAQWFPRMAAYTDVDGWQNKPFVGSGEFTLEFGRYTMNITVPDTYVVAGTGELANPGAVLTRVQQQRLAKARTAERPVMIVTSEEAADNEQRTPKGTRTWTFRADDVRDVAWAASPSFLWDAWGVKVPGTTRTTMTYPGLSGGTAYEVQRETDRLGRPKTIRYFSDAGMTSAAGTTPDITFQYDLPGNRTDMVENNGIADIRKTTYDHDALNRVTDVNFDIKGDGSVIDSVAYGYDLMSRRTSLTMPGNRTVDYGYDPLGRLTDVTDWDSQQTLLGYDLLGRHTSTQRPNDVDSTYTYDGAGRLTQLLHEDTTLPSTPLTLAEFSYTVDARGNRTQVIEELRDASSTLSTRTVDYIYDPLARLTQANDVTNLVAYDYGYDLAGNLVNNDGTTRTYNAANQMTNDGSNT